jgi:hypothetical protein
MIILERRFLFGLVTLALVICVQCQEEEEAPPAEEAAPAEAPAEEEAAPAAADGNFSGFYHETLDVTSE